jgi:hypothetical protein
MDDDHLSFNRTIQVVQNQTKINTREILEKYKFSPKHKVPLCKMVRMPVVKLVFKIDILKMEWAFHMGYRKETRFSICLR